MSTDDRKKTLLWWRLPVSPDESAEVGRSMMKTVVIWMVVVVALVAALALVLTAL